VPPPDNVEPSLASGPGGGIGSRVADRLRNRRSRGQTSAASASLKFDIQGLKSFQQEVSTTKSKVQELREEFKRLTDQTKEWYDTLKRASEAMSKMGGAPGGPRAPGISGGTPGATANFTMPPQNPPNGPGGAGPPGGGTANANPLMQLGVGAYNAMNQRWQQGIQVGAAYDAYGARLQLATGIPMTNYARNLSKNMPFYAGAPEMGQALDILNSIGATYGGAGLAGQRGQAGVRSIAQMQNIMPGTGAVQAAGMTAGLAANVQGQKRGSLFFGAAAFKGTQDDTSYFKGILKMLEARRTGEKVGQPFSREELEAARMPGSTLNYNLSLLGWNDDQVNYFFNWAIGQAAYDPTGSKTFTGTEAQLRQMGMQTSVAHEVQKNVAAQGSRDLSFYSDQQKNMKGQLSNDRSMIELQKSMDSWLGKIYGVLAHVPTSLKGGIGGIVSNLLTGNFGGAISSGLGLVQSFIGDIGDNGFAGLNPDLKSRVGNMFSANPNLSLTSGYRSAGQQNRLWQSGNPMAAPPGKSRHGRGQAADIGPRSQWPWLQANARKFGLDVGTKFGEPWHVQVAGTMLGDVGTESERTSAFTAQSQQASHNVLMQLAQAYFSNKQANANNAASTGGGTGGGGTPSGGVDPNAPATPDLSVGGGGVGSITAGKDGKVSTQDILKTLFAAGVQGEDLVKLASIPARESSYDPMAHNPKPPDDSYGLYQINMLGNLAPGREQMIAGLTGGKTDHALLYDPWVNINMAAQFYKSSGLNPWNIKVNGVQDPMYNVPSEAINQTRQIAKDLGYIQGDVGYGQMNGALGGGFASIHAPMNITNHFTIQMQGNGAGVNVNGLTRQIAAKLEPQVRRMQMARR